MLVLGTGPLTGFLLKDRRQVGAKVSWIGTASALSIAARRDRIARTAEPAPHPGRVLSVAPGVRSRGEIFRDHVPRSAGARSPSVRNPSTVPSGLEANPSMLAATTLTSTCTALPFATRGAVISRPRARRDWATTPRRPPGALRWLSAAPAPARVGAVAEILPQFLVPCPRRE